MAFGRVPLVASIVIASLSAASCVSMGAFRDQERQLAETRRALETQDAAARAERARLEAEVERSRSGAEAVARKLAEVSYKRDTLQAARDNDLFVLAQLKKRLDALGQNVQSLTQEKGLLAAGLANTLERLQEVHRMQVAAEARAATYRGLVERLQAMISAGSLEVVLREGRMLIVLPVDVLFDSGSAHVKPGAREALSAVAQALKNVPDRRFTVVGHTDDVPIHTARFRSSWDLSTARAVEVTLSLIAAGVDPRRIGAAGHGDADPFVPNDSDENRRLNRRVEIELEPNLAELPPLSADAAVAP